jgi:predicted peptidase
MRAIIALICSMLAASIVAQDMPKNQSSERYKGKSSKDFEINYLLFLPKNYKAKGEEKFPLMLFLHGAGERGTNLSKVAVHGPPKIVKDRPDFPFIVVSPQCPNGQTWADDVLLGLLDEITKKYNVDENRVYLTGLSMGGYATWSLGLKNPDRFAAIAPICGGGNTLDVLLPNGNKQSALKKLPVWAFQGGKDPIVKPEESERMISLLKEIGNPNTKLTIYPEAGHDSWTETYNNQQLYDWMLEHSRGAKPQASRKKSSSRRSS